MPSINVENEEIYYSQIGNKKAEKSLFFIPGSGMTKEFMGLFSDQFAEYNTITVDLPGHGESCTSVKSSVEDLTSCLAQAIKGLIAENVLSKEIVVLGYSLGGFAAISLGLQNIPEIKQIVIISSCADLATNPLGNMLKASTTVDPDVIYSIVCGSATPKERAAEINQLFLDYLRDADLLYQDLVSAAPFDILSKVSSVSVPVLVVIGDEDQVIQPKDAVNLAETVQDGQLITYKGFGHGMLFENTAQVIADIKKFIK